MAQPFEMESMTGRCASTGQELVEGQEFYTVLFEEGDSFRRTDYSVEAWQGAPDDAYCCFKTRVPFKARKKQLLVNNELLISFFERLAEDAEEARIQFRFVLALILMRKRILRYDGSKVVDGVETWTMMLTRNHTEHLVVNPQLTDDQIESVGAQLGSILHSDMGEWVAGDEDAATSAAAAMDGTDRSEDGTSE